MHEIGQSLAPFGWLYMPIQDGDCTNKRPVRADPDR